MNYKDFLKDFNINILMNEIKNLKEQLNNYKNKNEQLIKELNEIKKEKDKLNIELIKANTIISCLNPNNQGINNNISNLNEIIKIKDKKINELMMQLQNNFGNNKKLVDINDFLIAHFISMDGYINCPIKCLKTDIFAVVEEKLYQKYEKYREKNNTFLAKGRVVLRFKKIFENGIKDGDKIQLVNYE